jgi:hypothetical protein
LRLGLATEAEPVTEIHDSVRAARAAEVRADFDSPLPLMLGKRESPGILDRLDHVPLDGVIATPHPSDSLARWRVAERVGDDLEPFDGGFDAFALGDDPV